MTPLRSRKPGRRLITVAVVGALLTTGALATPAAAQDGALDRQALRQSLDAVHEAGMYGIYADVRDGAQEWKGASGVADVATGRPVHPDMRQRIGSITKSFTSVAILQQVARGAVDLDAPLSRYLPGLVPGERGDKITVRMVLNHTSGIDDYIGGAFPSLLEGSTASLDDNRFRTFAPRELVSFALAVPQTREPGATPGVYANTNYIIAGLLLEKVTGVTAEDYITRNVIDRAGLKNTSFPKTPHIPGPHSKAYESWYGYIDPPRDYSVYNMSWAWTAGAIVSTAEDLDRFYRALLGGRLIDRARLADMQTTVPVRAGGALLNYGLGLYAADLPCGRFWGHDGAVFGMGTFAMTRADGRRQTAFGMNLMKYERLDENGNLLPSPIDAALNQHILLALCGDDGAVSAKGAPVTLFPTGQLPFER
jgi:D-alanyl-D-alanine carboxypeptidase